MTNNSASSNILLDVGVKAALSVCLLVLFVPVAQAQSGGFATNLGQMFANGTNAFEALITLTKVAAYCIGIYLVIASIFKVSQLGSNPQVSPKVPLIMFVCGISIFTIMGVISIVSQTMAMGSGPGAALAPSGGGLDAQAAAAVKGVLTFIRLIGYIAFVRGWLLLNQIAQGKDGVVGRGLTHIFGGVAAINVQITAQILANTFAPGVPLPI